MCQQSIIYKLNKLHKQISLTVTSLPRSCCTPVSTAAAADWKAIRSVSLLISFMMTRWVVIFPPRSYGVSPAKGYKHGQEYIQAKCVSAVVLACVFFMSIPIPLCLTLGGAKLIFRASQGRGSNCTPVILP